MGKILSRQQDKDNSVKTGILSADEISKNLQGGLTKLFNLDPNEKPILRTLDGDTKVENM